MVRLSRFWVLPALFALLRCGGEETPSGGAVAGGSGGTPAAGGSAGTTSSGGSAGSTGRCEPPCFDPGDPLGHPAPEGALAAKQARAGRISREDQIRQAPDARQKVRLGDYLLVNDKIGVYIEDKGLSDGYARFGGGILAIDRIATDGLPEGTSQYIEQLLGVSGELVDPESVTVLADGRDGKAAIVRAVGKLSKVPFAEAYKIVFPHSYGLRALYDYILEPGSEVLRIRLGIVNDSGEDILVPPQDEAHAPLHTQRARLFTPGRAYDSAKGKTPWVGYDAETSSFAFRSPRSELASQIDLGTFQFFAGKGYPLPAGQSTFVEVLEMVPGGPHLDGLRAAVARAFDGQPWVPLSGTVSDAGGKPVPDVWMLEEDETGKLLSRTRSDASGAFTLHAPASTTVQVRPFLAGYSGQAQTVAAGASGLAFVLAPHGLVHVKATLAGSTEPLPVRIQIVPEVPVVEPAAALGLPSESQGRLHQAFEMDGEGTYVVPPGKHRVIVSHGYEHELLDVTVTVGAGATVEVSAPLARSVDSSGVMCGDFHVHSNYSQDARDPVELKVRGGVADGLDVICSSDHDWVMDFAPMIKDLGLSQWSYGMGSEELSTLRFGHFGVIPMFRDRDAENDGAVDWFGKTMPELFDFVKALPHKPILIVNHPSDTGFGKGYFSVAGFQRQTGKGQDGVWSDVFDGVEVFNGSGYDDNRKGSVADAHALVAKGKRLFYVGSSDSHLLRDEPMGYPRTCMRFGHDDPSILTPDLVRDALASGDTTVSGGLLLEVLGPGGERPGGVVATDGKEVTFRVRVSAPSWISAESLEIVLDGAMNGTVVALVPLAGAPGPGKVFENQVTLKRDPSQPVSWVVFHAKGSGDLSPLHPGKKPLAASSPIYLQ